MVSERSSSIRIELCCVKSCPESDCARAMQELDAALKELGLNAEITVALFLTEEEARSHGIRSSPILCADGKDQFFEFPVQEAGVWCRIYANRGEVASYPTRRMIRKALFRHLILRTFGRRH